MLKRRRDQDSVNGKESLGRINKDTTASPKPARSFRDGASASASDPASASVAGAIATRTDRAGVKLSRPTDAPEWTPLQCVPDAARPGIACACNVSSGTSVSTDW